MQLTLRHNLVGGQRAVRKCTREPRHYARRLLQLLRSRIKDFVVVVVVVRSLPESSVTDSLSLSANPGLACRFSLPTSISAARQSGIS